MYQRRIYGNIVGCWWCKCLITRYRRHYQIVHDVRQIVRYLPLTKRCKLRGHCGITSNTICCIVRITIDIWRYRQWGIFPIQHAVYIVVIRHMGDIGITRQRATLGICLPEWQDYTRNCRSTSNTISNTSNTISNSKYIVFKQLRKPANACLFWKCRHNQELLEQPTQRPYTPAIGHTQGSYGDFQSY